MTQGRLKALGSVMTVLNLGLRELSSSTGYPIRGGGVGPIFSSCAGKKKAATARVKNK